MLPTQAAVGASSGGVSADRVSLSGRAGRARVAPETATKTAACAAAKSTARPATTYAFTDFMSHPQNCNGPSTPVGVPGSRIGVARPLRFPAHAGYLELRVSRRRLEQRGI